MKKITSLLTVVILMTNISQVNAQTTPCKKTETNPNGGAQARLGSNGEGKAGIVPNGEEIGGGGWSRNNNKNGLGGNN